MKIPRIKPELLSLLTSERFEVFTAPELSRAYLKIPDFQAVGSIAAGQYILKNLKRLEKLQLIEQTGEVVGRSTRYRLSQKFKEAYLNTLKFQEPRNESKEEVNGFVTVLKDRLNNHQIELLTVIGEVEEYEAISHESPQQRTFIQEPYNQSRDNYSKLLGHIRALETLISRQVSG